MAVWSRWGFLVLLFIGIGVVGGFGLSTAAGVEGDGGPLVGLFVGIGLILAGALLYVFDRYLLSRLDKPQPAVIRERVSPPITLPNGQQQTFRMVPAIHPGTGQPVMTRPTSSFLWIPVRIWPAVMGIGGLVIIIVCAVQLLF
ncbi:MAG TPA: hypothetical protein VIP98_03580 [Microlunatus sp.]